MVLLYWLLQTVAGRDVLLAQIIARLPAGATLTWERVEGPIAGPLTIHGLVSTTITTVSPRSARTWIRTSARCSAGACAWTHSRSKAPRST